MSSLRIFATTKVEWEIYKVVNRERATPFAPMAVRFMLPPGRYELLRVPNPLGYPGFWLVLKSEREKDLHVGMAEGAWRQWTSGSRCEDPSHPNFGKPIDYGDHEIRIEEL